jgi:hypothetical protein
MRIDSGLGAVLEHKAEAVPAPGSTMTGWYAHFVAAVAEERPPAKEPDRESAVER